MAPEANHKKLQLQKLSHEEVIDPGLERQHVLG